MSAASTISFRSLHPARRIVLSLSLLALALGLNACGSTTPITSNVPVNYNQGGSKAAAATGSYTVQRGDTIYSVARQLNMSVRTLIDANNLQPPFHLTPGQVLQMPGGAGGYVVAKDDTLLGIARKTGVSFSTLARLNNMSPPYVVKVGQRLKLPATADETAGVQTAQADTGRPAAVAVQPGPVAVSAPTPLAAPVTSGSASSGGSSAVMPEKATGGYSPVSEREKAVIPPPPPPPAAMSQGPQGQQTAQAAPTPSFQSAPPPPPPERPAPAQSVQNQPAQNQAAVAAAGQAPQQASPSPASDVEEAPVAEQRVAAAASPPPPPPPSSGKGYIWPVRGQVLSEFGTTGKGQHNDGINIAVSRGAPVVAAQDGVVAYSGNELRGFGNLLLIKHADGWMTAYAHNDTLLVKRGETVRRGQQIAKAGDSGGVSQPQLHFEIRHGTRAVDPMTFLGGRALPVSPAADSPDPG